MKTYKTLASIVKAYETGKLNKKKQKLVIIDDRIELQSGDIDEDGQPVDPLWEEMLPSAFVEAAKLLKIPCVE